MVYNITEQDREILNSIISYFKYKGIPDIASLILRYYTTDYNRIVKERPQYRAEEIKKFLIENGFADNYWLDITINRKGRELTECGSLEAFEKKEIKEAEKVTKV